MLRIVLIEMQQGRHRPSQWFRDTRENVVLMWAGFGIRPSRTSWYNFAERLAPLIDGLNAIVLQTAMELGITRAERAGLLRNNDAAYSFRVISRTAVPLLKIYADHPNGSALYRDAMLALLSEKSEL